MITFLKINSSIRYKKFYPKYLVLYCNFNFLLTLSKQYNTIEGCYDLKPTSMNLESPTVEAVLQFSV